MTNERLRAQLVANDLAPADLAERVSVDPKTVYRWIDRDDRIPYPSHRSKVARALGVTEVYLWPGILEGKQAQAASSVELVRLYANRGQVPPSLWTDLVSGAQDCVSLLVYAGLFWFDAHPELLDAIGERADAGVSVRLAFGDPESPAVAARGLEEGIDMAARVRMSLGLIGPILGHPGIEVRVHDTPLYVSMYQGDDVMLANTHVYGSPAAHSPVLHLQRVPGGRIFDHYRESYEKVWDQARPYC